MRVKQNASLILNAAFCIAFVCFFDAWFEFQTMTNNLHGDRRRWKNLKLSENFTHHWQRHLPNDDSRNGSDLLRRIFLISKFLRCFNISKLITCTKLINQSDFNCTWKSILSSQNLILLIYVALVDKWAIIANFFNMNSWKAAQILLKLRTRRETRLFTLLSVRMF